MGKVLYRKSRPRSFDEVIGQDHIINTLKNAIKSGRLSHAYLFTGPRGVGKTSVARILAHEVNDLSYNDDSIHLDIIEIDGASNRRIDEIRELRERVHVAPTSAKYKVYIIDEVHMLTREAFNALLKTLEEPPAHCIFILATTEVHKLPDTIISRTQRFSFKPVSPEQTVKHLGSIAKREKIDISAKALELLADHGEGSFRDSISMLDQLSAAQQPIEEKQVRDLLGVPPADAIDKLLINIQSGDTGTVLSTLEGLRGQGVDAAATAKQLAKALRATVLQGNAGVWVTGLLKELLAVPASIQPDDYLEISVLEATGKNTSPTSSVSTPAKPSEEPEPSKTAVAKVVLMPEPIESAQASLDLKNWDAVVDKAKAQAGSLYATLRLARPELSESGLKLFFKFPLHQKKLSQAGNISLLSKIVEETTGAKIKIECLVDKSAANTQPADPVRKTADKPDVTSDNPLNSISNIFGSAEMLES